MADDRMPYAGIETPPRFDSWKRPRQRRWMRNNAPAGLERTPPQAAQSQPQAQSWYPAPQTPPPNFMPHMPMYEAGLRGLEDQYMANQTDLTSALNSIGPTANQQFQRMGTDAGYTADQHVESMADRGLWDSSVNPYLFQRDIAIPYGRGLQDLQQWAQNAYGSAYGGLSENALNYNQGWDELLLANAAEAANQMPSNVPQYSPSPKPRRKGKPGKKGGKK